VLSKTNKYVHQLVNINTYLQKFPTQYIRLSEHAFTSKPGQSLEQGHQRNHISHFGFEYQPKQII